MEMVQSGQDELRSARNSGAALLVSAFLFSIFTNLLLLTGPLFMLQVYDRVLTSRSEETLTALFLLVAALYAIFGVLDFARGRVMTRFAARFQDQLDQRVFFAMLSAGAKGAAKADGLRHLETVQKLLASPAMLALFDLPWAPLFIFVIFVFHPMLGWLAVGGVLALTAFAFMNNAVTRTGVTAARAASLDAQSLAETAARNASLIQSQGMGAPIASRWAALRDKALATATTSSDRSGIFAASTRAFRLFLQSAILAAGALLTLRGELSAGAIVACSILLGRAMSPIEHTLGHWPMVQLARTSWHALAALLSESTPETEKLTLHRPDARLTVRNLTVRRRSAGAAALTRIDFSVGPGEALGIIGKSGAGKSTLAQSLVGLQPLAAGEVRIGGATLSQYRRDDAGAYIGYLPQIVTLFDGTVAENIARMALTPNSTKVIEAAMSANAHEFILRLPEGYQTRISNADSRLSGGQSQRIALARALYGDPAILVLDEPNSALDAEGSQALNRAIRKLKDNNRAVIVMTHRPMALSDCDHLIVLDQGRVVRSGPRDEVLKNMVRNSGDIQKLISLAAAR